LLNTNDNTLQPQGSTYYDAVIVYFSDSGMATRAKNIVMWNQNNGISMIDNGMFKFGNYYVFGGSSLGFYTKYQNWATENTKQDVFIMKYLMDKDTVYSCLWEAEIDSSTIRGKFSQIDKNSVYT
jgi:hypothetical protein